MNALILLLVIIAAMWTPHIVRGIITRTRYYVRSHRGYTAPENGAK